MVKVVLRSLTHLLFQPGRAKDKFLRKHCSKIRNKKILEIGSGKSVHGALRYSVADYFRRRDNDVTLSDINRKFGHTIVNITKSVPRGYDIIVCFNVLEHVYDFHKGVANMHRALHKGGILLVLVPAFYPLHDEPHDYWRFTEHALRKLFFAFTSVTVDYYGKRQYPVAYFVVAKK